MNTCHDEDLETNICTHFIYSNRKLEILQTLIKNEYFP